MISFMVGCKKYFGLLPDQKLAEFIMEVRSLTESDRDEMAKALTKELGEPVSPDFSVKT